MIDTNFYKKIAFEKIVQFLGRNGTAKQSGVTICIWNTSEIELAPVTSKKIEGRAFIQIPVENIPQVTHAMLEAYIKIKANENEVCNNDNNVVSG